MYCCITLGSPHINLIARMSRRIGFYRKLLKSLPPSISASAVLTASQAAFNGAALYKLSIVYNACLNSPNCALADHRSGIGQRGGFGECSNGSPKLLNLLDRLARLITQSPL